MDSVQTPLYARTTFFLAFRWRASKGIDGVLAACEADGWKSETLHPFQLFSQQNYLHDYARGAVFQTTTTSAVYNFQKRLFEPFSIEIRNEAIAKTPPEGNTTLNTTATFATLDIYESGIGLFSISFDFPDKTITSDELLAFNDLGRRLYPQTLNAKGVEGARGNGLIPVLAGFNNIADSMEDFGAYHIDPSKSRLPTAFLPRYLHYTFGARFKTSTQEISKEDVQIENVFDDRMFVLSCVNDTKISNEIAKTGENGAPSYLNHDFWYKLVYVDGGKIQIENRKMQEELVAASTYARWSEDGTIYGASRYSFVALIKNGWSFGVMIGNYAKLVKLCLVQRAAVVRFREDATAIAAQIADSKPNFGDLTQKIRKINGDFIVFSNRLNFREATSYEQGIDLYDLIRKQMRVQEQVESLKEELSELYNYAHQIHESSRSAALEWLTILGAVFLVPSFLFSYYGFFDSWKKNWEQCHLWLFWTMAGATTVTLLIFYSRWLQHGGIRAVLAKTILLITLIAALALPFFMEWYPAWFCIVKQ
jgi:hypothetical protein